MKSVILVFLSLVFCISAFGQKSFKNTNWLYKKPKEIILSDIMDKDIHDYLTEIANQREEHRLMSFEKITAPIKGVLIGVGTFSLPVLSYNLIAYLAELAPIFSPNGLIIFGAAGFVIGTGVTIKYVATASKLKKLHNFLNASLKCSETIQNCSGKKLRLLKLAHGKYKGPDMSIQEYAKAVVAYINSDKPIAKVDKVSGEYFSLLCYKHLVKLINADLEEQVSEKF